MENLCNFCGLQSARCRRIDECTIACEGRQLKAQLALEIFRENLVQSYVGEDSDKSICNDCVLKLKTCYVFVHQLRKVQMTLLQSRPKDKVLQPEPSSKSVECKNSGLQGNKFRPIFPKGPETIAVTTEKSTVKSHRIYKCFECPQEFGSFRQLKIHEVSHELDSISICNFCCSLFANADALDKHRKEIHSNAKYICPPCAKEYTNKGHLLKHIQATHNRSELIYYCCLCPRQALPTEYSSKLALQQHFQEVHLLMPSNQEEDDVEMEMNEEFLDEFLLHNTNDNSFQFSECWNDLDLHLPDVLHLSDQQKSSVDEINAAYKCPKCYEQFTNQKMLITHLAHLHGLSILICNKCEASFQQWEGLWKHKATHRVQDTIEHDGNICKLCDKSFKSTAALNYHIKTHSGFGLKPHRCPYCSKEFQTHINMKQHLRIVHSQLKKHICLLCDKQFATLDHLKKHVLSQHQNERKHICQICSKGFTQLCHLKQHTAIHTTGKVLWCEGCNETFWRKIDLERHILAKHGTGSEKCSHEKVLTK